MALTNCEVEFYTRVPNNLKEIKNEISDLKSQVAELTNAVNELTKVLRNRDFTKSQRPITDGRWGLNS